jgi:hypothetical protein
LRTQKKVARALLCPPVAQTSGKSVILVFLLLVGVHVVATQRSATLTFGKLIMNLIRHFLKTKAGQQKR